MRCSTRSRSCSPGRGKITGNGFIASSQRQRLLPRRFTSVRKPKRARRRMRSRFRRGIRRSSRRAPCAPLNSLGVCKKNPNPANGTERDQWQTSPLTHMTRGQPDAKRFASNQRNDKELSVNCLSRSGETERLFIANSALALMEAKERRRSSRGWAVRPATAPLFQKKSPATFSWRSEQPATIALRGTKQSTQRPRAPCSLPPSPGKTRRRWKTAAALPCKGARPKRRRAIQPRMPADRGQSLGEKALGISMYRGERLCLYPTRGAALMADQHKAAVPGFPQLVIRGGIGILDMVYRTINLAIQPTRFGLCASSAGKHDERRCAGIEQGSQVHDAPTLRQGAGSP